MLMKVEIEFKTDSVNASQISQKIGTIINSVKQQGLDAREFSIDCCLAFIKCSYY